MRLDQVFDVPKDSQVDKIRGKFEDARLSLFMPKKVVAAAQRDVSCDKEKTVEPSRKMAEKKEECQTHKDEQKKTEERIQKATPKGAEAPKCVEATQPPAPVHEARPSTGEPPVQKERKAIPTSSLVSDEKFEECKKKAMALKVRIEEEVEGWLDYGLMDGLLETISKNKKTIAIAAAAFSAGFYISRKLRSS